MTVAKRKSKKEAKPIVEKPIPQVRDEAGRPTIYTQALADELCAQLAVGKSLRTVCQAEEMPAIRTIFYWLRSNEEFLHQYARAKEESADALADEILDISDDGSNDWMDKWYGENIERKVDPEAVQRSKLRVDTRKWVASKLKPKKYGDKIDLTSDGKAIKGNTIVVKDFSDGTGHK